MTAAQLHFDFVLEDGAPDPPDCSRTTAYWRKRLAIVAAKSYALGSLRQRQRRKPIPQPPRPHALGADVTAPVRLAWPCKADRNELHELAARLRKLSVNRRDPEAFHVEKSEIENALRAIAKRS